MYRVLETFHDMQDNNYLYEQGKEYPRKGMTVLPSRIKELATNENRMGKPLIEEIETEKPNKTVKNTAKGKKVNE